MNSGLLAMRMFFSSMLMGLACFSSLVLAGTVDDGLDAFKQGDFTTAHEIWKPLAEAGDERANYFMSQLYAKGKGVARQEKLAMEYLAVAARGGHIAAQFNLGNHYNQGRWVEENPTMAAYWWRRAGSQAMPRAQHNLASLYLLGRGVDKDIEKARHWYQRAAGHGVERAKLALAKLDAEPAETPVETVEKPSSVISISELPVKKKMLTRPQAPVVPKVDNTSEGTFVALDQNWLKQQPGALYTLQLLATDSRKAIERLLEKHHRSLKRQVAIYHYRSKSNVYFGASYGRFQTLEMAKAAIDDLPESLARGKPWPRHFADIQALLVE